MKARLPSTQVLLRIAPFDFPFNFVVPMIVGYSLDIGNPTPIVAFCFSVCVARNLLWMMILKSVLAPVDQWAKLNARGAPRSDELLHRAIEGIRHASSRFLVAYTVAWVTVSASSTLFIMKAAKGIYSLGPRYPIAGVLGALTILFAAGVFGYTMSRSVLAKISEPIVRDAQSRGLTAELSVTPIRFRVATLAVAIALAPVGWLGSVGLRGADNSAVREAMLTAEIETVSVAALGAEARRRPEVVVGVVGAETALATLPAYAVEWARDAAKTAPRGTLPDAEFERAFAFTKRADGALVVAVAPVSAHPFFKLLAAIGVFFIALAIWAPISAWFFGLDLGEIIGRVTSSVGRVVDVGDVRVMEELPVMSDDEVGDLTRDFNRLTRLLRDLAGAAERVSKGELRFTIDGRGDLPDAFRGMADGLRELTSNIRETSVQLASAAAEIYSASQEQEAAATQQSAAISEVSSTMDSLAGASAHISESAGQVLADAERTRSNTDQMAVRIAELNQHAGRIGELLESIRDVADRSDILALNGSLEATRAGDAGRGFSLVASEMRRLAERVTATVENVRVLVADVRSSGASTVMATEQSRKLAESTTDIARRITLITQQQRSATEQVTSSVRDIANVVTQAAAATTQTRMSAEELKVQADKLGVLVNRFQVEERRAAT